LNDPGHLALGSKTGMRRLSGHKFSSSISNSFNSFAQSRLYFALVGRRGGRK